MLLSIEGKWINLPVYACLIALHKQLTVASFSAVLLWKSELNNACFFFFNLPTEKFIRDNECVCFCNHLWLSIQKLLINSLSFFHQSGILHCRTSSGETYFQATAHWETTIKETEWNHNSFVCRAILLLLYSLRVKLKESISVLSCTCMAVCYTMTQHWS